VKLSRQTFISLLWSHRVSPEVNTNNRCAFSFSSVRVFTADLNHMCMKYRSTIDWEKVNILWAAARTDAAERG